MPSQNQVHCWSSSDKLSSEVIFDPLTNCYYGVFNYTRIGKWLRNSLMMKDMKKFNVSFCNIYLSRVFWSLENRLFSLD